MEHWILIANPHGDAELVGIYPHKRNALFAVSGNYHKSVKVGSGEYELMDRDATFPRYLVLNGPELAVAKGYDYLLV